SYRTDTTRRTLAGHSLGGTFGAYALLREPELFANYVLISPALWYGDHAIAAAEDQYSSGRRALKARVYMAVGDLEGPKGGLKGVDLVNDQIAFAARLRSRNYDGLILRDEVLSGVSHATSFPASFLRAMEWLFPAKPALEPP
ncbi:MAG: alpha/beta hydrolase, partial [Parvularculaceae bacterium]|nr:alpha/beta hydrolase [Parvularculaceae bacterium]